jgi:peptidyl-prolyl cis-trans isomerase SurA
MTDKVWNKAMKDTVGLKNYFEQNRAKYVWGKRVDALVYECATQKIADQVAKMIAVDTINSKHVLDVINKDSELNLRVRTNKFDLEQTAFLKDRKLTKGVNKSYEFEGKFIVLKVNDIIEPTTKMFTEAKGAVTSDYQNYLEMVWLQELNKKHTVKIYESVLYAIGQ